ncbi:MAG: protein kinase [Elusimicrobiota bacterium]
MPTTPEPRMRDESPDGNGEPPASSDAGAARPAQTAAPGGSGSLPPPKGAEQHPSAPKIEGYVLTAPLRKTSVAQLWKGWRLRDIRQVAVKVFTESVKENSLALQQEVMRLIRLGKHPHILEVLDADLTERSAYYVTDLMDVGSLERYVKEGKPAPARDVARWMEEICGALSHVHAMGLVHGDLRPANILLDREGRAWLADFGQSREVTESSAAPETLAYLAPEQTTPGNGAPSRTDARSDVYGLGATMYAVLTGGTPRKESRGRLAAAKGLRDRLKLYREIVHAEPLLGAWEATGLKVDIDLSAIVGKCLQATPEKRYQSMPAVRADLEARRHTRPVGPLAHRPVYRFRRFLQRNAFLLGTVAVLVALVGPVAHVLRKEAVLRKQVAFSYAIRGRQLAQEKDYAAAAVYYARSNSLEPAYATQANALASLHHLRVPAGAFSEGSPLPPAASPPGGVAVLAEGTSARLWDLRTGETIGKALLHDADVTATAFSPDGKTVLTGSRDGTARFWGARTGEPVGEVMRHKGWVSAATFSPDGSIVATSTSEKAARVWQTGTGKAIGEVMLHEGYVKRVVFSPDGARIVTASSDNTARLWDARTGRPLGMALRHRGDVTDVAFSPDGARVVTAGADWTARLWDARTGKPVGKVMRHRGVVAAAAFSPDGARVVTGGADKTARLWDARTGKPVAEAMRHTHDVAAVAMSPDGGAVATGDAGGTARLWDPRAGKPLGKAMRHEAGVTGIAFSPDGKTLATASRDGSVRLWDARTGEPLGEGLRHGIAVGAVFFGPRGDRLFTQTIDKAATRMWDTAWLSEDILPERLWAAARIATRRKIDDLGRIETISEPELDALRKRYDRLTP